MQTDLAALRAEREARRGAPPPASKWPTFQWPTFQLPPLMPQSLHGSRVAAASMLVLMLAFHLSRRDPLANGIVPAAAREPHEHWHFIKAYPSIVRDMTANARKPWWKRMLKMREMHEEIESADYGGEDGHDAEDMDDGVGEAAYLVARDMHMLTETMRVTRCSTTSSALVGYFCGREIQHNQDRRSDSPKGYYGGSGHEALGPFNATLTASHAAGERALAEGTGGHARLVYRLGVAPEDGKAGYAHVWSIVALPTGRFLWLQSFIGHYSLHSWLRQLETEYGEEEAAAGLTLVDVHARLDTLATLFRFDKWDAAANAAYHRLFWVDMIRARGKRDALTKTEAVGHQRLGSFSWDVACEFPTPAAPAVSEPHAPDLLMADVRRLLLRELGARRAAARRGVDTHDGSEEAPDHDAQTHDEDAVLDDMMGMDEEGMAFLAEALEERYGAVVRRQDSLSQNA